MYIMTNYDLTEDKLEIEVRLSHTDEDGYTSEDWDYVSIPLDKLKKALDRVKVENDGPK